MLSTESVVRMGVCVKCVCLVEEDKEKDRRRRKREEMKTGKKGGTEDQNRQSQARRAVTVCYCKGMGNSTECTYHNLLRRSVTRLNPKLSSSGSRFYKRQVIGSMLSRYHSNLTYPTHNPRQATSHNHHRQDNPSINPPHLPHLPSFPFLFFFLSLSRSKKQEDNCHVYRTNFFFPNYEIDAKVQNLSLREKKNRKHPFFLPFHSFMQGVGWCWVLHFFFL